MLTLILFRTVTANCKYTSYAMKSSLKNPVKDELEIEIPDFKSGKWVKSNRATVLSNTQVRIKARTVHTSSTYITISLENYTGFNYQYFVNDCRATDSQLYPSNVLCYVDIYEVNSSDHSGPMYGQNAQLGTEKEFVMPNPPYTIKSFNLLLQNLGDTDVVFSLPKISLRNYIYDPVPVIEGGQGKYTVNIGSNEEYQLSTLFLKDPWPLPRNVLKFTTDLAKLPIVANGSHIIGIDIEDMLAGAAACDAVTRQSSMDNPAMLLALMWYYAGSGKGLKDMVILPYKDRLELLSKYLQQLIMESLGKALDLDGNEVHQGIAVYGNKGSTDQHAFVQQLRDGINNFFVTFIEVQKDRESASIPVEPGVYSGDYLQGFLLGTRQALFESGRESITITISDVSPYSVGILIALYERAVGFYASLININAYHQPGVEAGKKAANEILKLKAAVQGYLIANKVSKPDAASAKTVEEIAAAIGRDDDVETIFKLCEHLAGNSDRCVIRFVGSNPGSNKYQMVY